MGDATPEFPHGLGQAADLQQLSARLDASEQRFQRAFEHIPDVVVIYDTELRIRYINAATRQVTGQSEDFFLGKRDDEIFPPEVYKVYLPALERALATGQTTSLETELCLPGQSPRALRITCVPVQDERGQVREVLGITHDSTRRQRAENALRRSEAIHRAIAQNVPRGLIFVVDPQLRYLVAEGPLAEQLGLALTAVVGRAPAEVIQEPLRSHVEDCFRRALAGESSSFERPFGGRLLWTQYVPLRDDAGQVVAAMSLILDVTEQHENEQALRESEERYRRLAAELEQRVAERTAELQAANEELDGFAYAVSHDLRAPLRAMSGFSQALEEDYGERLDGEAKVFLEQISLASRRMGALIDGLLVLSRSTRGELQRDPVDLSALAARIREELTRGEPGREMVWEIEPGLTCRGDERMLEAVLRNLLGNAWKYTGATARPEIRFAQERRDGVLGWIVADNGAGFSMDHAVKLFQPFQRLHRQDEFAGIGIGLATVQRIVHRHGGQITATAAPGEGATFWFTVPEPPDSEGNADE